MKHGEIISGHIGGFRRKSYGGLSDKDIKAFQKGVGIGTSCDCNQVLVFDDDYIWSTFYFKWPSDIAPVGMHTVYTENNLENLRAFDKLLYFQFANYSECDKILRDNESFDRANREAKWSSQKDSVRQNSVAKIKIQTDLLAQLAYYCYSKTRNNELEYLCILVPNTEEDYQGYCRDIILQILKAIPAGLRKKFKFSINPIQEDEEAYGIIFRRDDNNVPLNSTSNSIRIDKDTKIPSFIVDDLYPLLDISPLIEQCIYEEKMRDYLDQFEKEQLRYNKPCDELAYSDFFYSKNTIDAQIKKMKNLDDKDKEKVLNWMKKLIESKDDNVRDEIFSGIPKKYHLITITNYCVEILKKYTLEYFNHVTQCFNTALKFCVCDSLVLELRIHMFLWHYPGISEGAKVFTAADRIEKKIEKICSELSNFFLIEATHSSHESEEPLAQMRTVYHEFIDIFVDNIENIGCKISLESSLSKVSELYEKNLDSYLWERFKTDKNLKWIVRMIKLGCDEIKNDNQRKIFISTLESKMMQYAQSDNLQKEDIEPLIEIIKITLDPQSEIILDLEKKLEQVQKRNENMTNCDSLGQYLTYCLKDKTFHDDSDRREKTRANVWRKLKERKQPIQVFQYYINQASKINCQDLENICKAEYNTFTIMFCMGVKFDSSFDLEHLHNLLVFHKTIDSKIYLQYPAPNEKQYNSNENKVAVDDIIDCIELVIQCRDTELNTKEITKMSPIKYRILGNLNQHGFIPSNVAEEWAKSGNNDLKQLVSEGRDERVVSGRKEKKKKVTGIKNLVGKFDWKKRAVVIVAALMVCTTVLLLILVQPQNQMGNGGVKIPNEIRTAVAEEVNESPPPLSPYTSSTSEYTAVFPDTVDGDSSLNDTKSTPEETDTITGAVDLWIAEKYAEAYAVFENIDNGLLSSQMISPDIFPETSPSQALREFFAARVFLILRETEGTEYMLDNVDYYSIISVPDIDLKLKSDIPIMLLTFEKNGNKSNSIYYYDREKAGFLSFADNLIENDELIVKIKRGDRIITTRTVNILAAVDEMTKKSL